MQVENQTEFWSTPFQHCSTSAERRWSQTYFFLFATHVPAFNQLNYLNMGARSSKIYAEDKFLTPTEEYPLVKDSSQLRFLDFEIFKLLKKFPEANKFTTPYNSIKREQSIFIFISHVWLTGNNFSNFLLIEFFLIPCLLQNCHRYQVEQILLIQTTEKMTSTTYV